MIRTDADVLTDLAREGLVEICFSVITLNEALARRIEMRAPSPRERITAAAELADKGIPVSFHVAPVIPGMNSAAQMDELGSLSGRHVFNAVLGAQKAWWGPFTM